MLRFVGALLARPALRSNAAALRTFLPPLLRPILELLPGSRCCPLLCFAIHLQGSLGSTSPTFETTTCCHGTAAFCQGKLGTMLLCNAGQQQRHP